MKNNLCIIGLTTSFTKHILNKLATQLDMLYADVNEMLEFDLIDVVEARQKTSASYIDGLETKKIKELSTFENVMVGMDYQTFMKGNNSQVTLSNYYVLFLNLTKPAFLRALKRDKLSEPDFKLAQVVYTENTQYMLQNSDMHVDLDNLVVKTAISKIIKELQQYKY